MDLYLITHREIFAIHANIEHRSVISAVFFLNVSCPFNCTMM